MSSQGSLSGNSLIKSFMVSFPYEQWRDFKANVICRDTISKESAASVPGWVQDLFYLTAVLNSCINPVVYGHYYHGERRRQTESSRTVMSEANGRKDGDRQIRMKRIQWNREDRVRITINNNSSELIWMWAENCNAIYQNSHFSVHFVHTAEEYVKSM